MLEAHAPLPWFVTSAHNNYASTEYAKAEAGIIFTVMWRASSPWARYPFLCQVNSESIYVVYWRHFWASSQKIWNTDQQCRGTLLRKRQTLGSISSWKVKVLQATLRTRFLNWIQFLKWKNVYMSVKPKYKLAVGLYNPLARNVQLCLYVGRYEEEKKAIGDADDCVLKYGIRVVWVGTDL